MGTTNTTIGQLAADANAENTALASFLAAFKAFVAGLSTGSSGTTLSAADQLTVNQLDAQADAALAAIQAVPVPVPATPPTAPAGS